ncbi:MAG: intradiol ring-cleavage dioxygenase [Gemmatimonadota bacterium]
MDDDKTTGRILSRREVLAILGTTGAGLLTTRAFARESETVLPASNRRPLPACVVRPAQTEGPYFVDEKLNRSDIRPDPGSDRRTEGWLLDLEVHVGRVTGNSCEPLQGALVDLWQCDAVGIYSGVRDTNNLFDTRGQKFLRGHQLTSEDGVARFTTIFPGWYEGRTAHIHFKIRLDRPGQNARAYDFTSQIYFDDALADAVYGQAPYNSNTQRRQKNAQDGIYRRGGSQLLVPLDRKGAGLAGRFEVGLVV